MLWATRNDSVCPAGAGSGHSVQNIQGFVQILLIPAMDCAHSSHPAAPAVV